MRNTPSSLALLAVLFAPSVVAQSSKSPVSHYPPIQDYLMPQASEIALAKSAAPPNISEGATIKVLTTSGFKVVHQGDNGFVCMVMRGFSAPTYTPAQFRDLVYDASLRAPICFDPKASKEVMPFYELRTKLAMQGKNPDQIGQGVQAAYDRGELPKRDGVSFAYMWSADQNLGSGIGHWHPHMMVFAPFYENSMVGANTFGALVPQVSDDAGTPFSVVVIPVDHNLFVKAAAR
jgi:hypothetical protein